ncbi:MAG TPA: hypothetical protein ENN18_02670 [Proteobacteria bacterium]|nr:hypothetical protein [Pseudomonadota bacterium]
MKRKIIVTTFVLFFSLAATGFCQERSPFEEAPKSLYNYEKALATLNLKGIITTDRFSRAIFLVRRAEDKEAYAVFSPGDKFCVTVEGLKYTFTVKSVEKKSVTLLDADGKTYGVSP